MNNHIGNKSCLEFEEAGRTINRILNTLFKGKPRLGDLFDWFTHSCEVTWHQWEEKYRNDIPSCLACSLFVKNSKMTFVIEAKIDFNPFNNNEEHAKQKFRQ